MASKKSAKYPHKWPDGTYHSKPWSSQLGNIGGIGINIGAAGQTSQKVLDAPPPLPDLPQPFDPEFEAAKLGAQWNVQISDGDAGYQRGQLAYNTGYNADGTRNTANPYAQAQLLEDSWRRSQTGTNNSMAASGQYFSGARLNAQARNDREYAIGSDTLRRGTGDQYYGISRGQLQSYAGNSLGVSGGAYEALRKSLYPGS